MTLRSRLISSIEGEVVQREALHISLKSATQDVDQGKASCHIIPTFQTKTLDRLQLFNRRHVEGKDEHPTS